MVLKDVEIAVMAVLNDSTGTLMSCAHKNLDCKIGVIIGKDIRPVDDEIS
jgi:hexokinase